MAVLKIKDKDGNYIPIPAIKGEDGKDGVDGKDYVLTDADKQEIANLISETSSERPTGVIEIAALNVLADNFSVDKCVAIGCYELPEQLSIGTEIKDIEFSCNNEEYISIYRLYEKDNVPYTINFSRVWQNDNGMFFALIGLVSETEQWLNANFNVYVQTTIRLTYYTD